MRTSLKKQEGVVIIVAMLMVALMSAIAYALLAQSARDTERTQLILREAKINSVEKGALLWAKDALTQDWLHQKPTQLVDVMPMTLPDTRVDGFQVRATLDDMQGYYNINNLMNENASIDFINLLKAADPKIDESTASEITTNTIAWLKPPGINNELDRYYAQLPAPYRAAHRQMVHVSELKLVKGMREDVYQALLPYVTTLPEITSINPQTATAPVLMSLTPAISLDTAKAIIVLREGTPFVSNSIFEALPIVKMYHVSVDKINTVSAYFRLKTVVSHEDEQWVTTTLLARHIVDGRAVVSVIYQNKGGI